MFDWWTGTPHASGELDALSGHSFVEEPPETPAHLFAVRAFKSALFGTPAHKDFEASDKEPAAKSREVQDDASKRSNPKIDPPAITKSVPLFESPTKGATKSVRNFLASPAKGILLTPGTGPGRRKKVSFRGLRSPASETLAAARIEEAEVTSKQQGQEEKLGQVLVEDDDQDGQLELRRSLFQAQDYQNRPTVCRSHDVNQDQSLDKYTTGEASSNMDVGDMTIDLKQPRSRSGQHWKKEYQRDHNKSKTEMRKLIRYSQVAKSYAVKKDSEAMGLNEKLKKAEMRAMDMESRVTELAAQLAKAQLQNSDVNNQAELVGDLTSRMAQTIRYKHKAEKYKLALEAQNSQPASDSYQTDQVSKSSGIVSQPAHQAEAVRSSDLTSLRSEVVDLRFAVEKAEHKAADLDRENMGLKHMLARVKEEMKNYGARHQTWQERQKRRDAKSSAQKQSLRDQLSQLRQEYLLKLDEMTASAVKERADHAREIKLLIKQIRNEGSSSQPLNTKQDDTIQDLRRQIYQLKAGASKPAEETPPELLIHQRKMSQDLRHAREELRRVQSVNETLRLESRSQTEPSKRFSDQTPLIPQVPSQRAPAALTQSKSSPPKHSNTATHDSDPKFIPPNPDNSVATDTSKPLNQTTPAPRPRPRHAQSALMSSRASTMPGSARAPLPPDRAEAARRRLEIRSAEKGKAKKVEIEAGKENWGV